MLNYISTFIYIFLYMLPFAPLRYYPFLNHLIIPTKWVAAILISITIIQAFGFIYLVNQPWYIQNYSLIYHYIFAFIFGVLSFVFIKEIFSKVMFIYLLIFCYSNFILGNSFFIEANFFSYFSSKYHYLTNDIIKIILITITYPFVFYFLKKYLKNAMKNIESDVWKYIWINPLIFNAIGIITDFNNLNYKSFNFIILRYFIFIGTFVNCFFLFKALKQTELNVHLKEDIKYTNKQINLQREQYALLNKNIEETKKTRHDLRHHITLIQNLLNNKQYDKLKIYFDQYQKSLPLDNELIFCKNYMVNTLLSHYVNLANNENISVEVDCKLPAKTFVSDLDFCIIIGNCFENAIDACKKISEGKRFISIKSKNTNNFIGITIDNNFSGEIHKENDTFMSTKNSKEHGIGISSVHAVAAKYAGTSKFQVDNSNKLFKVSIFLKTP
ncbi:sensory histidine kinase DcuS [Clostridium sp. BL-8]|nr:sensory histidine kinase DcuS [Clostridium sp. BL-8]